MTSRASGKTISALIERCLPELHAFVRLNAGPAVRSKESCSDLVQTICRELLEHSATLAGFEGAAFRKWLFTAALHKIYDRQKFYRAARRDVAREARRDEDAGGDAAGERRLSECYATFTTPSRAAMSREERERLESAFDRLSDQHRSVLVLSRLGGLSHAEIAEVLESTETGVRKACSRAMARLILLMEGA